LGNDIYACALGIESGAGVLNAGKQLYHNKSKINVR
jgi:hypothetical protein